MSVLNPATTAVTTGNLSSFIDGFLRRSIGTATGNYDFPVGNSAKGYQLASVNFITPASSPFDLLSNFNNWAGVPNGPSSFECMNADYSAFPALNNGYWTINSRGF